MPIAVIPARFGSSRLGGKPLVSIAGKPMIQRVFEQSQKSSVVTKTIVATDDERIVRAVNAFGGDAVMTSDTCRSGTDRVAETAKILGAADKDIIINIQGDQPVFNPKSLEDLIRPFDEDPGLAMSTLAYKIKDPREITDPKDVKVVFNRQGFAMYFSRAQIPFPRDGQTDVDYYKHLGFYAYTKAFLDQIVTLDSGTCEQVEKLEQLRVLEYGYPIRVAVTQYDSPEIDLPEDIERVEAGLR
ncbi:3-deoxy-manno-octulosonate cytidylyltransferase [Desulfobacter latus]|uniref:3-deoxy-manno-octulosonate cytidylyltransferase n=1 Tax=Desulfobacter latus TaxID=2292 RepID=A0A850T037_9BACT|nr:3-deoxy-manno-octulosonate cytidylyltransferase [Desulfobacter latus]NWH04431.1 3-deoxy-manno-octulosonate cytidylyltransferase [Desulfobacter latus]